MRRIRIILVLALLSLGFTGWSQAILNQFLDTSVTPSEEKEQAYQGVHALIASMKEDASNDQRILQRVFHKVHTSWLKKYEAYANFNTLFTEGTYDCLTATSLFSYVLNELNYEFDIVETNYHIFILVQTTRGQVMLETTDRLGGFVTNEETIAKRIGDYRKNSLSAAGGDRVAYQYGFSLYREVPTEKLTGLLIFNQAVKAYNGGAWLESARSLRKAEMIYSTPRCDELKDILIRTMMETKVRAEIREECLKLLSPVRMDRMGTMAANATSIN